MMNASCKNGERCDQSRKLVSRELKQEAIDIINRGLVYINGTAHPILDFEIIPGAESNSTMLGF